MEVNYIVFFDGVCNLCNATVDFLIKKDKRRILKFSSLQSVYGQKFLKEHQMNGYDFNTVIYYKNGNLYKKSDAFIEIMLDLNQAHQWMKVLRFIPQKLRDFFYDSVAKNRYFLFGKKETCRLPSAQEKKQFLE